MLRLITFDLDDTLWESPPVLAQAEERLFEWFDVHTPRVVARFSRADLLRLRETLKAERPDLTHDVGGLRRAVIARALECAGYGETALADEAFEVFLAARHTVTLYADAQEVLERLHARVPLAVITNGNADVTRLGLGHYFRFSVNPTDVGHAKPAPEIFHHTLQRAQVRPEQALHIGDSLEHDVAGARTVGMHHIWLNRRGLAWPHPERSPPLTIASLADLLNVVEDWLPARARA